VHSHGAGHQRIFEFGLRADGRPCCVLVRAWSRAGGVHAIGLEGGARPLPNMGGVRNPLLLGDLLRAGAGHSGKEGGKLSTRERAKRPYELHRDSTTTTSPRPNHAMCQRPLRPALNPYSYWAYCGPDYSHLHCRPTLNAKHAGGTQPRALCAGRWSDSPDARTTTRALRDFNCNWGCLA